jgi:hypothetical protein
MTHQAARVEKPRIDRRLDERQDCLTGLNRWLESSRKRLGLRAIALAAQNGCLVAGAGSLQQCEELAAIAPLLTNNGNTKGPLLSSLANGVAFLCAPTRECSNDDWTDVQHGCLRILGLNCAA